MSAPYCHICNKDPNEKRRYGSTGLAAGDTCPVCYQPFCRYHGGTVRWRWRATGELDNARVCLECKTAYRHREWDPINRDWIS